MGSAKDYIAVFWLLATQAGIEKLVVLLDHVLSGPLRGLIKLVLLYATILDSIKGYYQLAIRSNLQ